LGRSGAATGLCSDRYTARAENFWYAIQQCDKVLFVRTGVGARAGIIDLVNKLEKQ